MALAWKNDMHDLIDTIFAQIPCEHNDGYKKQKSNFYRGSISDEEYLRSETTKLFYWLGRVRLDPNSPVVNLRQLTQYRPDTYFVLFKFAQIIHYYFSYDPVLLQLNKYGGASIERLIVAFLNFPNLFQGIRCSANEPQKTSEIAITETS